jgi:hypothetical protein
MNIKLKFVLILWKYISFYIKKAKQTYYTACYRKLYILSNELFPHNSLGKNSNLAIYLTSIYINNFEDDLIDINKDELDNLKLVADSDEWIKKGIPDFYRIISFSFIFNIDLKNGYIEKAKAINQLLEPIRSFKEVIKLVNDVKKDSKAFLKKGREISEKTYEKELNNKIPIIKISSDKISFFLTVFSTFFLISGIIYSKIYFYLLGINISDFFSVSDYLASSIDVLMYTFFSMIVGMIFYRQGIKDSIKNRIQEEQFNIQTNRRKNSLYIIMMLNIFLLSMFCINYYINHTLIYTLLYIPLYSIFFKLYDLVPIWKYVENPLKIDFIVSSFATFSILLILTAFSHSDEILRKEIKDDNYKIVFQNEDENKKNLIFITSNSTSVFLLNTDTKKVKIIPLDSISSIEKK